MIDKVARTGLMLAGAFSALAVAQWFGKTPKEVAGVDFLILSRALELSAALFIGLYSVSNFWLNFACLEAPTFLTRLVLASPSVDPQQNLGPLVAGFEIIYLVAVMLAMGIGFAMRRFSF